MNTIKWIVAITVLAFSSVAFADSPKIGLNMQLVTKDQTMLQPTVQDSTKVELFLGTLLGKKVKVV
jgi:hypothetical protein